MTTAAANQTPPTCKHCGSLLSITTWECVRGAHCPRELGRVATTCLETAYGTTQRLSFQIKVF